jgi:hypothetical protein
MRRGNIWKRKVSVYYCDMEIFSFFFTQVEAERRYPDALKQGVTVCRADLLYMILFIRLKSEKKPFGHSRLSLFARDGCCWRETIIIGESICCGRHAIYLSVDVDDCLLVHSRNVTESNTVNVR